MKKILIFVLLLNFYFANGLSQNSENNNVYYDQIIKYKDYLTKNKSINLQEYNVWKLIIYKSDISKQKFEFLLSFTPFKIENFDYNGYMILNKELVLIKFDINDLISYKLFNFNTFNDSIIYKANKKLIDSKDYLYEPSYRFIRYSKGKEKIEDLESYLELPFRYRKNNKNESVTR